MAEEAAAPPKRQRPVRGKPQQNEQDKLEKMAHSGREEDAEAAEDKEERRRVHNIKQLVHRALYDRYDRARNLLSALPFQQQVNGNIVEFYSGRDLPNETLELLLHLTRANMKLLYDKSAGWAWSDTNKRGELRNEKMRWLLVRRQGEDDVKAFAAFRLAADSGVPHLYLHELQVIASERNQGLGSALMRLMEAIAKNTHMHLIMLTVLGNNDSAMRFYEKLGFTVDEASPGPCYNVEPKTSAAYEILSKTIDPTCLRYSCTTTECAYKCRYSDSLEQHNCYKHGRAWPFPCPSCEKGTVLQTQLHKHIELAHPALSSPPLPPAAAATAPAPAIETADSSAAEDGSAGGRGSELLNDRVVFKATGRKGTVIKVHAGFFTVRMDGPKYETVACRVSAFEGFESIERVKKTVDPDWEFAMQLQLEDGWARRSTRGKPS
jgi:ribosomal protein S18 acetylase RimI-like enzyme